MRNLLKSLHYVSTNLAEIRLNLYDAMTKYPDDTWKNVENMLAGANYTIETAMAEMYAIEEMAELKEKITMNEKQKELAEVAKELVMFIRKNYTPQTTAIVTWSGVELLNTEMFAEVKEDAQEQVIQATEKLGKICDVDEDL